MGWLGVRRRVRLPILGATGYPAAPDCRAPVAAQRDPDQPTGSLRYEAIHRWPESVSDGAGHEADDRADADSREPHRGSSDRLVEVTGEAADTSARRLPRRGHASRSR